MNHSGRCVLIVILLATGGGPPLFGQNQEPPPLPAPTNPDRRSKSERRRAAQEKHRQEEELNVAGDRPVAFNRTWSYLTTDVPKRLSPAVRGDRAYLPLASGRLVALQLESGNELWTTDTGNMDLAPVAAPRFVIAAFTAGDETVSTARTSVLRAYHDSTGVTAWAKPFPAVVCQLSFSDACGLVLVGLADGAYMGIKPDDGSLAWTVVLPSAAGSEPVVQEATLWMGTMDGHVCQLDLRAAPPRLAGTVRLDSAVRSRPAVNGESVFAATSGGFLYRLNRRHLRVEWSRRLGAAVTAAVELSDEQVMAASFDNYVYAFEQRDGSPRWRRLTDGRVEADMHRAGRVLLVSALRTNRILALDPRTGAVIGTLEWSRETGISGPISGNSKTLLIPTDEGIYAATLSAP